MRILAVSEEKERIKMTQLGSEGKVPSPSTTCEEASSLSHRFYIACGRPATKQVYHRRDNKTYAMCDSCTDHNVTNRGGEYV